jgi:hypothetical protein
MDLSDNCSDNNIFVDNENRIINISDDSNEEKVKSIPVKNTIVKRINENDNQNNNVDNYQNEIQVKKSSDRNAINFMGNYCFESIIHFDIYLNQ